MLSFTKIKKDIYWFLCHYKIPNLDNVRHVKIDTSRAEMISATHNVYRMAIDDSIYYFKEYGDKEDSIVKAEISRILAYEAMGKCMCLSEIVVHSELCLANIDGRKNVIGILQKESIGSQIRKISHDCRKQMLTPSFQRKLIQLRYLDTICCELDHSLNNYYPVIEEDRFVSISAFDNGGIGTFGLNSRVNLCTYYGCSPLINDSGMVVFPYIDRFLIDTMSRISFSHLWKTLNAFMGWIPVFFYLDSIAKNP